MKNERTEYFLSKYFVDVVTLSHQLILSFNRTHGTQIPPMTACLGFATKNNFIGQPLAGYDFPDAIHIDFEEIDIRAHIETTIQQMHLDKAKLTHPYFALVAKPMVHRLIALHIYLYQTHGWCFNLYDTLRFKDTIKREKPLNATSISFAEFIQQNDSHETAIPATQKARYLPTLSSFHDLITHNFLMVPTQPTDKWSYHCRGDAVDGSLFDIQTGKPVWVLSPISFMHPLSGWGPAQPNTFEPASIYTQEDYLCFFEELDKRGVLDSVATFYEKCTQEQFSMTNIREIIDKGFNNREKFRIAFEKFEFFPWATENWHLTLRDSCYESSDLETLNLLRADPLIGEHNPEYFGLNATDEYTAEIYSSVVNLLTTNTDLLKTKSTPAPTQNMNFFQRVSVSSAESSYGNTFQ